MTNEQQAMAEAWLEYSNAEAKVGMETEVQRAADREQVESNRIIAQTDAEVRRHHEWRMNA